MGMWIDRNPNRMIPTRKRLERLLLNSSGMRVRPRGWPYDRADEDEIEADTPWSGSSRKRDKRLVRRLKRLGLAKVVRARHWGDGIIRRNSLTLTDAGREAAWAGELPVEKPKPKSQRREKRGRHV